MSTSVTLPNLISVGRLLVVPLIVWLITTGQSGLAFWLFVASGVSDGVDGFIAKRYNLVSTLGAYLDPVADKALLVSIYISLGYIAEVPAWLVILVVSRDMLIVGGVLMAWVLDHPIAVKPIFISKLNTAGQIVLASIILARLAFDLGLAVLEPAAIVVVAILTAGSAGAYLVDWLRHMTELADSEKRID